METKLHIFLVEWKNLDVINFNYNCKMAGTTFETIPTICISLANEGKTQVRWANIVG
jgi:hypothetical protein